MRFKIILVLLTSFFISTTVEAQLLKKVKKRAKEAAEEAVIRKTEEKAAEKTEKAIDTLFSKTKKVKLGKGKKKKKGKKATSQKQNNDIDESIDSESSKEELQVWSKYNFVPGDEIIFYDDLSVEESGEFPSRWDIIRGNAENGSFNGENVIAMKHEAIIMPLMDTHDYLPEVFTIEFDIYFDVKKYSYRSGYSFRFGPGNYQYLYFGENKKDFITPFWLTKDGVKFSMDINGTRKNFKDHKSELEELGQQGSWRHVAIAYNKRSLKIFIDEYRVLNIPNLGYKPDMFSIGYSNNYAGDDEISIIKNIRIAEGGKKLYDRVIADGKFVTRGILFDVNQATLKPESMGVISKVAKMMQEYEDLNFNIEGHTDSDGEEEYNLNLSAQRAEAVKQALIDLGIDESRLTAEGKGESVPVAENTTPEGKANNRRVEFVKL